MLVSPGSLIRGAVLSALVCCSSGCLSGRDRHSNGLEPAPSVTAGTTSPAESQRQSDAAIPDSSMGKPAPDASFATPTRLPSDSATFDASSPADGSTQGDSSTHTTLDAGSSDDASSRVPVSDLAERILAAWGSSVCAGYGVPSGSAWPWLLERKFSEIKGPEILHVSTPGQVTDSKESPVERSKIASADFVVVCLSLGNQGLGSTAAEASAQRVVDSYVDDIFLDDSETDGDPTSLVNYIKSVGAFPIVTLVYPMAEYSELHCRHVVDANILQQSLGIPTINLLGTTNAGNNFGAGDCNWADGRNAPLNAKYDARHPNQLGHMENFYAFPPDLPFALATGLSFPVRPTTTDYYAIPRDDRPSAGAPSAQPIQYTPQYDMHSYTMQFSFQGWNDGTLASVALGANGFVTVEVKNGSVQLLTASDTPGLMSTQRVTDGEWHDAAVTYSHVRQKLTLYVDGSLVGEQETRDGTRVRELFPQSFVLGGPSASGRAAAPSKLYVRDLFINRVALHAREIEERSKTAWVGAGSLDVYAPLRISSPTENLAQTLQKIRVSD